MVDSLDSGSSVHCGRAGSSPASRTRKAPKTKDFGVFFLKNVYIILEGDEVENYTKYALKPAEQLTALLEGKDNLFVIACNKCFKEFDTNNEPDLDEFLKLANDLGKTVVGTAKADFLCNETKATKGLPGMIPENAENVVVISCGLGIQTVAAIAEVPV